MSDPQNLTETILATLRAAQRPLNSAEVAEVTRGADRVVKLTLGRLVAQGQLVRSEVDGVPHYRARVQGDPQVAPRPRKPRQARQRLAEEPVVSEPIPFDAGVFLDGTLVIQGDGLVGPDGVVRIGRADAERLRELLNRHAPPPVRLVEGPVYSLGGPLVGQNV